MTSSAAPVRTRSRRRRALSLAAIVDVALHLVDAEGVDAVSMRRVATEFGTGPASLYAHVKSKDALLTLVWEKILAKVRFDDGPTWQDTLRNWAHGTRTEFRQHSDAARLGLGQIPETPPALAITERLLTAMIDGGVPPRVAGWTLDSMALFVAADLFEGWLMGERFTDDSGRDPRLVGHEYFTGVAQRFAQLPARRYPSLTRHLDAVMGGDDEARFGFGVDLLIAGVASRIPAPGNPAGVGTAH